MARHIACKARKYTSNRKSSIEYNDNIFFSTVTIVNANKTRNDYAIDCTLALMIVIELKTNKKLSRRAKINAKEDKYHDKTKLPILSHAFSRASIR